MIGFVVKHRQLGLGKILTTQGRAFSIRFLGSDQVFNLGFAELHNGGLTREVLGLGCQCILGGDACTITRVVRRPAGQLEPFVYEVKTGTGEFRIEDEVHLEPIAGGESSDPLLRLASLQPFAYPLFRSRETLRSAYARAIKDTAGLRALLGSRLDLRPHQAFVAGTVVLDPRRRYILADEVGLGKTIEAGIVIHDLLTQKPDARVLVLCPGALTQQWLTELYAKFSGQLFTLLDLHTPASIDWGRARRVIASLATAVFEAGPAIEREPWDMVVVDEAHHLLGATALYDLVERLSRRATAVLLLSAMPAHEREDELLKLLALLEPERYGDLSDDARRHFAVLHEQQPHLGRGLRLLDRRLASFDAGELRASDVCAFARKLLDVPVVASDEDLRSRIAEAEALARAADEGEAAREDREAQNTAELAQAPPSAEGSADVVRVQAVDRVSDTRRQVSRTLRAWAHDLADRYRLSRRVLRNRRARLLQQEQIAPIERRLSPVPFSPSQAELDAWDAIQTLLAAAASRGQSDMVAQLARWMYQSAASADGLHALLTALARATPAALNDNERAFLAMGPVVGHADWTSYRDLFLKATRSVVDDAALLEALQATARWVQLGDLGQARRRALSDLLREREPERPKLIIFAGYPGLVDEVHAHLAGEFGEGAVAAFRASDDMERKEAAVQRFHRNDQTWLLVSDESGGEGRNFQFAAALIHYDTPWYVARVEQRIGRLDRLGREVTSPEVVSTVIYNGSSVEAGLVRVYADAVGIYRQSVSGLEFALRDVERRLTSLALEGGEEALTAGVVDLTEIVRRERQRDDAEAVLDEASCEASAAARFRAISRSDRLDAAIEHAFVDYMKQLTENHGARSLDTPFGPGAVWRFQPERTCYGALPIAHDAAEVLVGNHDGTFRRRVAQQSPRLQFFNVGDPLYNAVIRSLDRHATGRAFALELTSADREPWVGVECRFVVASDDVAIGSSAGLRNRADALFVPKPIAVLVDLDGRTADPGVADTIVSLRRKLDAVQRGQTWWDLCKAQSALASALGADQWPHALEHLVAVARAEAARRFAEDLAAPIAAEQARVSALADTIRRSAAPDDTTAERQISALERFAATLPNWTLCLDAVGILSVNGQLRRGRYQ